MNDGNFRDKRIGTLLLNGRPVHAVHVLMALHGAVNMSASDSDPRWRVTLDNDADWQIWLHVIAAVFSDDELRIGKCKDRHTQSAALVFIRLSGSASAIWLPEWPPHADRHFWWPTYGERSLRIVTLSLDIFWDWLFSDRLSSLGMCWCAVADSNQTKRFCVLLTMESPCFNLKCTRYIVSNN